MVRVYMACSLDGFVAGPDHDIDWLNEADQGEIGDTDALEFGEFLSGIGCMLMGRNTHDLVLGFGVWHYGDIPVLVPTHRPLEPANHTVRAVSGDIRDLVAEAVQLAGDKDVYLDGGDLVRQAIDADLVDEFCITWIPILLAGGISLFDGLTVRRNLEIVSHHTYGRFLQVTMRRA